MYNKRSFAGISLEEMDEIEEVYKNSPDLVVSKPSFAFTNLIFDFHSPHLVKGISLVFVKNGSAKISVNLVEYTVQPCTVALFLPHSILEIKSQTPDFEIGFLFFTIDFVSSSQHSHELRDLGDQARLHPFLALNSSDFDELLGLHGAIAKNYTANSDQSIEIARTLVLSTLLIVLQHYSRQSALGNPKEKLTKELVNTRFIKLLHTHYSQQRSVQFYADQLHLTPKYFSKLIKQSTGKTAGEWIDELVIVAAKGMLKSSNLTVAQISEELNFANPSFFGRYFKSKTGLTPKQFQSSGS